jgi:hypothetical protein
MRAYPARIMAEIRSDYNLSVREAWAVYRDMRDYLKTRDEKPSLAALERHKGPLNEIVEIKTIPLGDEPTDYDDYESDYWEITSLYGE